MKTYLLKYPLGWRGERVGWTLDIADAMLMTEADAKKYVQAYDPTAVAVPPADWVAQVGEELRAARLRVQRLDALQVGASSAE